MDARLVILTGIHQRNRVIKMLFLTFEGGGTAGKLLITGIEMHLRTVCQFLWSSGNNLLQERLGFLEFVFLHGLESGLIILHSLCKNRVLLERGSCRRSR